MDKVQIIPPPKEVDPRVLAWKGAAVLGKMDSVADIWLTPMDWVRANLPQLEFISHCRSGCSRYARVEGALFLSVVL
jgi:hypothetical protein